LSLRRTAQFHNSRLRVPLTCIGIPDKWPERYAALRHALNSDSDFGGAMLRNEHHESDASLFSIDIQFPNLARGACSPRKSMKVGRLLAEWRRTGKVCSATPTHSDWSGAFRQRASLYFDLNIIADHANVVRRNSHLGRRVHDIAGFQIEARTMP